MNTATNADDQAPDVLALLEDLFQEFPDPLVRAAADETIKLRHNNKGMVSALQAERQFIRELRDEMKEAGIWKDRKRKRRNERAGPSFSGSSGAPTISAV